MTARKSSPLSEKRQWKFFSRAGPEGRACGDRLHLFPREEGCRGRHGEAKIVTLPSCCCWCCDQHTRNGGLICRLSSRPSLSAGFSIQDEAMDVSRSTPLGLTIGLLAWLGIKKGRIGFSLRVRPTPTRFPNNILYVSVDNIHLLVLAGE